MAIIKNQKTRPKGKYLFCLFFFQYQKRFKHLKIFHITHSYKQFLEQKGQIFKVLSHDPCHWTQTFYSPLDDASDGDHILIYGHGTLSGDRLPHPNYADPSIPDNLFKSIYIKGLFHLKSMILRNIL